MCKYVCMCVCNAYVYVEYTCIHISKNSAKREKAGNSELDELVCVMCVCVCVNTYLYLECICIHVNASVYVEYICIYVYYMICHHISI
jgi:hypothetical protein